jgi:hypothetical protein
MDIHQKSVTIAIEKDPGGVLDVTTGVTFSP